MESTVSALLLQFLRSLSIRQFVRELRAAKVRRLNEALDDKRLCPAARELLEEELSTIHVRQAMGLHAHRAKREKLCELIRMSGGELPQTVAVVASPRLVMREGKVVPDFDPANKRPLHRGLAIGAGIALFGYLMMMVPTILVVFGVNLGIGFGIWVFATSVLVMAFGLYLMRELEPLQAAHRIAGTLEKLQRDMPTCAETPAPSSLSRRRVAGSKPRIGKMRVP